VLPAASSPTSPKRLAISPTPSLWLVPCGGPAARERHLPIERHTISYLVSVRDLVERRVDPGRAQAGAPDLLALVAASWPIPEFDLEGQAQARRPSGIGD